MYLCIYIYMYWRGCFLKHDMSASADDNVNFCFLSGRLLRSDLQEARYPI